MKNDSIGLTESYKKSASDY